MRWLWLFLLWGSTAFAEEKPLYTPYYNGSFWDVSVRGGQTDLGTTAFDVGLRQAFVMHLADTRLSYRRDLLDGADSDTLHLGFGLHPLYVALLGSDWLSYVVASFYVELGMGLTLLDGPNLSWSAGTGLDIPLWDADTGMAPWLNLLYRYEWTTAALDGADIDRHTGFVGLAWRINGLIF